MLDLDKANMIKDQAEVVEEIISINRYIKQISDGMMFNNEAQDFIVKTVNKYRNVPEVLNFYCNTGPDDINSNQLLTLYTLLDMIKQYVMSKYGEEVWKKWSKI